MNRYVDIVLGKRCVATLSNINKQIEQINGINKTFSLCTCFIYYIHELKEWKSIHAVCYCLRDSLRIKSVIKYLSCVEIKML